MEGQGAAVAGGIFALIIWLVVIVALIAGYWKVFAKAGQPGWAALIPIYNLVVLLQVVKKPIWWLILFFIPIVNFIIMIMIFLELAKVFGKGGGFAVGLILLNVIFVPILGFGSAEYQG